VSSPEEYKLRLFMKEGYHRKTCKVCGTPFWTLNADQDVCMDSPCVDYTFEKINVKKPLTVDEARQAFLGFFERKGHTVVSPRPVVARWREDLYLTIASIVVFQPHVTSGIVPPPANPLVISQPCIRLEDIDNVGLTLGRHLSIFEMGGHHAFNKEDDWKYWKEETVSLAIDFFEKEIGIKKEDITLKESWWEGGGNAGPSFEVVSGGLELATLVFMQYKVTEKGYEPIPLKIVDTGYGIERIAWFTQKTPTAFHAIYGGLLDETRRKLGLQTPEPAILRSLFVRAGRLKPSDRNSISQIIAEVSNETGLDNELVTTTFMNEARMYSVVDHSKTLVFMLADGIVPSNQGEGYLARLVLRRALKQLLLLGSSTDVLLWLIDKQIDMWSRTYKHLKERYSYIMEVVDIESQRFLENINTNMSKALSVIATGNTDSLKKIYQEYGIPPEIVAREYERRTGRRIDVPDNFYAQLAKESSFRIEKKEEAPPALLGLPETRRIFHENPYASMVEARVLYSSRDGVVLDQTVFYPTGGGQNSDTGYIIKTTGEAVKIKEAVNINGRILHVLDNPNDYVLLKEGEPVRVAIDWERRYRLMKHHTATHILLGSLRRVLGPHVWQAGAEKTPDKARLDITHYKPISTQELASIEELANKIINMRIPLKFYMMDKNIAEERYGFSIYQGGVPMSKQIRIVEIPGHDAQACYGTHVTNTGEVGALKITSIKKIQDGVYRIEFVAGTEVSRYAMNLEDEIRKTAEIIGGSGELSTRAKKMIELYDELKSMLSRYRKYALRKIKEELVSSSVSVGEIKIAVFRDELGDDELSTQLLKELVTENQELLVLRLACSQSGCTIEISAGERAVKKAHAGMLARELASRLNGKGGGKDDHAYLKIPGIISVEKLRELALQLVSGSA
jgi:alanyl-tRNA synthetase